MPVSSPGTLGNPLAEGLHPAFMKSKNKTPVDFSFLGSRVGVILPEIYNQTFPDWEIQILLELYLKILKPSLAITNVEEQKKCAKPLQCSVTFERCSNDISDNREACYYSAQSPTFPNWHLSLLRHKLQQNWNLNSRAAFVLPEDSCSCFYSWSPILLVSKFVFSLKRAKGSSARSLGWFEAVWSIFLWAGGWIAASCRN